MKIEVLILSFISSISVFGQAPLTKPFDDCKIKGSITIYDYNVKKWICSDINDSHFATLPASTFKIINTLIALETGVITDEHEMVQWPGKTDTARYYYRPDIYHDMNLKEAFKVSAGWVYIELAKKIGKEHYKRYLSQAHYGNADVSIDDPDFWNFGNLTISPANQIEILMGVYEETLPFSERSFKLLKEMMIEEQTADYTLRAKTGLTRKGNLELGWIGWWVGYVEREDQVYFFATRLIKDTASYKYDPHFAACRKEITKTILRQLNIID